MKRKSGKSNMTLASVPFRIEKYVSAREFIELSKQPGKIVSSKLVLPKLGSGGFGKFKVTLKSEHTSR